MTNSTGSNTKASAGLVNPKGIASSARGKILFSAGNWTGPIGASRKGLFLALIGR